jgi:uncharacterized protein
MPLLSGTSGELDLKDRDNGVLILIKPKVGSSAGKAFIATGYGLEGAIPDLAIRMIIDNEMIPAFRGGNYYEGLNRGSDVLMSLSAGEFTWGDYQGRRPGGGKGSPATILGIFLALVIFSAVTSFAGAKSRQNSSVGKSALPWWILLGMMSSGRNSGGKWDSFSSGRGSFGGFGGGSRGGFGGFGGGSFGGGGAGGSW